MMKAGIDQDALITMFAEASAKQGAACARPSATPPCARSRVASSRSTTSARW